MPVTWARPVWHGPSIGGSRRYHSADWFHFLLNHLVPTPVTTPLKNIRNFCIVAHIDHGKSTLADRLLEATGTVTIREMKEQLLDDMELERQRGITIKARAVSMKYKHGGQTYELNLIDTPGHVDFHYEVSRSLTCCEGALLLVDAAQGVEAQTVANGYAAMEHDLAIIPVINKIDLVNARVEEVTEELEHTLAATPEEVMPVSAKTGQGVQELLEAIVSRVPPPEGDPEAPLQAMVFDSMYDKYRGAITYVRIMNGTVRVGDKVRFLKAGTNHEVTEIGQFAPRRKQCEALHAGQVGYIICNIKTLDAVHVGDTMTFPGEGGAGPAWLPASAAYGLLRAVPQRRPGFRGTARRSLAAGH